MRRTLILGLVLGSFGLQLGCSDESPTGVGSGLVGDGFRTYEVLLDAAAFLRSDTTYDRIGELNRVGFGLVAEDYAGELDAHTLFQISRGVSVSYQVDGSTVTDTLYTIVGGTMTLVLDSLAEQVGPVDIEVVELTESWDRATVSWDARVDTAGVSEPWTEEGGTPGAVLGEARWVGGDTIIIPLDSASASVWGDSASARHGGFLRTTSAGARIRISELSFSFDVVPESNDTIVPSGSLLARTLIASPAASTPDVDELRVGGAPAWRSALHFEPLKELRIPCSSEPTTCTLPLSQVEVNLAALLLDPIPVGSRQIERFMRVDSRAILQAPGVPLSRSPMTPPLGRMTDSLTAANFADPLPEAYAASVPITQFVRQALEPDNEEPVLWLALTVENESDLPIFGYAAFASLQTATPPKLQLVVTVPAGEATQ